MIVCFRMAGNSIELPFVHEQRRKVQGGLLHRSILAQLIEPN